MTTSFRPAAVITAYRPGPSLVAAVHSAVGQVQHVVVVDDGSPVQDSPVQDSPVHDDVLHECAALGATVIRHDVNRGIGAALNTGIRELRRCDPLLTHVLTMDQDSELPDDYVVTLSTAEQRAIQQGVAVGMTSPSEITTMRRSRTTQPRSFSLGGEPIQSGLLLPLGTLDAVGDFDESLVIDGVDSDYWLRALDLGLTAIVAPHASLVHQLGQPIVLASGHRLPFGVASEFRYFYQWRNLVRLVRRHGRRHPRWATGAVVRALRHLSLVTVFAPGRRSRLRLARRGLLAGVRGDQGLIPGGR